MKCPKCLAEMEKVTHGEIEVDRCTDCRGIWFDMLEHEHLKAIEDSESIDIGDTEIGKRYDKFRAVNCPACQTKMIPMVDLAQPHICYEACTVCYGVFFDAGEFKDYAEHTIADFFKDLLAKKRK
ncbi:zf-TFIIB domain-containing protein [Planctomycetota bacterium]